METLKNFIFRLCFRPSFIAKRFKAACNRQHVTAVLIPYNHTNRLGLPVDATALTRCNYPILTVHMYVGYRPLGKHVQIVYIYVEQRSQEKWDSALLGCSVGAIEDIMVSCRVRT